MFWLNLWKKFKLFLWICDSLYKLKPATILSMKDIINKLDLDGYIEGFKRFYARDKSIELKARI